MQETYQKACVSRSSHQPFSLEEHRRFTEALERLGDERHLSGKEWQVLAASVGGERTPQEVRM